MVSRRRGGGRAASMRSTCHAHHHRRRRRRQRSTVSALRVERQCRPAPGTSRHETAASPADDVVARTSVDDEDSHTSTATLYHTYE